MTHTVLIIENLIICPALWEMLKGSPIIARLLSLSKSPSATGETKSKIIRIVTNLSKDTPPIAPPKNVSKRNKYENVNIRLYEEDSKVQDSPYIPQPKPRELGSRSKMSSSDENTYTIGIEKRHSKYSKPLGGKESSLKKVGYSSIHDYQKSAPLDYNKMEEKKNYLDYETPINSYSRQINQNTYEKPQHKFDDDYNFPLEGGARRDPIVKIPFNDNLLHDYCCMLDKENNRDINIFAIQSIEPLIKD